LTHIDFLLERFDKAGKKTAIVFRDDEYLYEWLVTKVNEYAQFLDEKEINGVVALHADFSPYSVSMLLATIARNIVVVPISPAVIDPPNFHSIAQVQWVLHVDETGNVSTESTGRQVDHPILVSVINDRHPGLVLFSSGSTGDPKAAVHDFVPLLQKFRVTRPALKTISFLLFDHIGGVNTLIHVLSNLGTIIVPDSRSPSRIAELIENHHVELLPTSPSFLNLLIMSGELERRDLTVLRLITYGTEPMPEATLKTLHAKLPETKLKQTYGLSELGIMRTKSKSNDSLWMKVGGEDYETRVVDGKLEIKAKSAMKGYLNAPSPFTDDGWFRTGDKVEADGEWIKILGRESDLINVGGEKVYPAEVESAILELDNIRDVSISGRHSGILGTVVQARVVLHNPESSRDLKKRIRSALSGRLENYKIPAAIEVVESLTTARYKREH